MTFKERFENAVLVGGAIVLFLAVVAVLIIWGFVIYTALSDGNYSLAAAVGLSGALIAVITAMLIVRH